MENPNSYHVSWEKYEHKILLSEECIVKLKIGLFTNEVLCDIMMQEHPRLSCNPACLEGFWLSVRSVKLGFLVGLCFSS